MRSEKKKVALMGIFIVLVLFLSFYFDSQIVQKVSLTRSIPLNSFFVAISSNILIFVAFVFLTFLLIKEGGRKLVVPFWLTLLISEAVGFLLKNVVQRQRPFQLGLVSIIGVAENSFSFPSLHAMLVFSAVPFLSKRFPRFKYVWIAFACLVAFSRIYLGAHWPTDVLGSYIIGGILISVVIAILGKKKLKLFDTRCRTDK